MKKLIVFIIAAFIMNVVIAQTTAVNESFESWLAPGWNIYEYGGGHWVSSSIYGPDLGYGGGNCAKIQINNDPVDNWLVSPQVNVITGDYQLTFYELNDDLQYYVYEGVYISTGSGNPDDNDFVPISESLQIEGTWVEHTVDLSSYQGDNIYIAFVYQGTWTHWNVDEVVISPSSLIDAALTEIVNPTGINPTPSMEDVIVTLHNYGTDPIMDIDIEWHINGVQQSTYIGTGLNLVPGDNMDITVGQYNFAIQDDYAILLNHLLLGDANPSNDSIETIYYVSDPKDAALTHIEPEGYTPITGNKDVVVTVLNNGNFTFDDVTVEWEVNGLSQADFQVSALNLEPGDEIDLTIGQYNFTNGLAEITCNVVISADEDLSNNSRTSYATVNILWESFEGEVFPPEMWSADDYPLHDNFWPPPHGDFYYVSQTDDNMFGEISDTLWTPLLDIETGDEITFMVNNSNFFTNDDKLIWRDGTTGVINEIEDINSQLEQWDEVTIDISGAAGINYIGFVNNNNGSFGTSSLDMITSDASIYQFNDDLGIRDFQFDYLAKIDESHTFSVSLRNYGLNQVQGSSYTVKLMDENGVQLADQSGITLQNWEETTIEIEYIFSETEVLKVYAVIDYSSDQAEGNNTSVTYSVYSVPADIVVNDIGYKEVENLMIPFNTGGNTMSLGEDDISQHLYYQDELNMEGYLYGVTLYYHELFG
ncbi:MAG: choice-of-anchor J domain-containing protein, partial [Bacteroidota bacterium]